VGACTWQDPSSITNEEACPASPSSEDFVPDEAHYMVAQEHWEDRVLWDTPHSPGRSYSGVGGVWKVIGDSSSSATTPFSRQLSTSRASMNMATGSIGSNALQVSATPTEDEPRQSMFGVDNYELVYGCWEDKIIWDAEAMTEIPSPTLPHIDPNDSNFIIGIPEEPAPVTVSDKDNRKVR